MLFNSFQFLVFFPLVALVYFRLPFRFRWVLLLAASYYFYACWRPEYLVLILSSTLVDYLAALGIGRARSLGAKRGFLALSLSVNFGLLFSFKYLNFFGTALNHLFAALHSPATVPALDVLLPVGISFYTFQEVSYVIDVYRGVLPPQRHPGIFALYVSFFPQLVAGPIERSPHLMPQFLEEHRFDPDAAVQGLRLMLWGLFKKVAIADNLALWVDLVYRDPHQYPGPALTLATICFAFQIYCDFSGYCDIAVGAARILGFRLMQNFRRPYHARSIAEFWQRWHVSLSSWFRDYLYIPLGGRRVSVPRWYLNLLVVFTISGLWHGANWTFLVWGALHGVYYVAGAATQGVRGRIAALLGLARWPRLHAAAQTIACFALVSFAWIFFRADSLESAGYIASHLPSGWGALLHVRLDTVRAAIAGLASAAGDSNPAFLGCFAAFAGLAALFDLFSRHEDFNEAIRGRPAWVRWTVYAALTLATLNMGVTKVTPFIYFQF